MPTAPLTWQRSTCPYDCPECCGMLVQSDGQNVLAVRGDPDHGHNRGRLCAKVGQYQRTVHHAERLLYPLLRTGPKGTGQFTRISWDEALQRIAQAWQGLLRSHGGESILPVSYAGTMGQIQRNAGHALFHRLGASRLDRTICTPAQDAGWQAVMGERPGPDPDDAAQADLLVIWGCNVVATNLQFVQRIREAKAKGAQVWLIDTYRQASAGLADQTLIVKPGSDAALALGAVHWLAENRHTDEEFLARAATGWDELRAAARAYPLERVAELTGVTLPQILCFYRALGDSKRLFVRLGGGLTRYAHGAATARAILCIPAVLGAWERGGGLLASTGTGASLDMAPLTRPDLQPQPTRLVNLTRLGEALLELRDPPIQSICVFHCNPAAVLPDQERVLQGLSRPDLFTVVHERFMTDTARFADVLLPAPTMLETADLYRSYGQFWLQRTRPVIAPPGEVRSNLDFFQGIAKAMGLQESVFRTSADALIDQVLDAPSPWRRGLEPGTPGRAALDRGEPVKLTPPRLPWGDAAGLIRLVQPELPDPVPHWRPGYGDADGLPFKLVIAPSAYTLNSSFAEREDLRAKRGPQALRMAPADALVRGLNDGQQVRARNSIGQAEFILQVRDTVPAGVVVAEGVHWLGHGNRRSVNALTSARLTDLGRGSTYCDNGVEIEALTAETEAGLQS